MAKVISQNHAKRSPPARSPESTTYPGKRRPGLARRLPQSPPGLHRRGHPGSHPTAPVRSTTVAALPQARVPRTRGAAGRKRRALLPPEQALLPPGQVRTNQWRLSSGYDGIGRL